MSKSLKRAHGADGNTLTIDMVVLEGDLAGPAAIFVDMVRSGLGNNGLRYLGQNHTSGGTTPSTGDHVDSAKPAGWPNPAPNGPPDGLARADQPLLTTPPGTGR